MKISNKIILLLIFICSILQPAVAQKLKRAEKRQAAQIINLINRASAQIKTIRCSFIQVSNVSFMDERTVSKGKMYYNADGSLVWQYISPYKYIFSIEEGQVMTQSGNQKKRIDVKGNALFENITEMMMNFVSGKILSNNRDFIVDMYLKGKEWVAFLTPKRPEIRKMFKSIHLHFSPKRKMVQEVEMIQANGDQINITLSDVNVTYRK